MGKKGEKLTLQATKICEKVVQDLASLGNISSRKMFGGFGIFEGEAMFALINSCGNVYLKVDELNKLRFEDVQAEQHGKMPYFEVPQEVLEDPSLLEEWAQESIHIAQANKRKAKLL